MITFFNRKEIFVGSSIDQFNNVRERLIQNNIKYTYRVMDRNSSNVVGSQRGRTGTLGQDLNISKTYYLYVHKKDYEQAIGLIGRV